SSRRSRCPRCDAMTLVVVLRPRQFTIAGRAPRVNGRPGHHWRSRHPRLPSRYLGTLSRTLDGWRFSNALIFLAWMRNAYHAPVISFALASPRCLELTDVDVSSRQAVFAAIGRAGGGKPA